MNQSSKEPGVTVKTIQSWISVLEASYIFFIACLLQQFGQKNH